MSLRKIATVGSTVVASALALAASASADVQIRTDLKPGDVVHDHGVGAVVPPPGHAVFAEALLASGDAETLTVLTERDGTVVLTGAGSEAVEPLPELPAIFPESTPRECDDGAYRRSAWTFSDGTRKFGKWKSIMNWWYNPAGTPADVDRTRGREAVRRAVRNVVTGRNDCGMADQVSASQDYQADTTTAPNFAAGEYACAAPDGKNVVGWGKLYREGVLAATCAWAREDGQTYLTIHESDVKISTDFTWYADRPTVCVDGRYGIEPVMTHEFGHSYGLGHVEEETHPNLTMSTHLNGPCQDAEVTLGKGDVWGLQSLY